MTQKVSFLALKEEDLEEIVLAFKEIGWHKPRTIYETYLLEQSKNIRSSLVAKINEKFCGNVTIRWKSEYPSFHNQNIPEISDLNVLPQFRKQGIGTRLISACEEIAKKQGYVNIGIGVGLTVKQRKRD